MNKTKTNRPQQAGRDRPGGLAEWILTGFQGFGAYKQAKETLRHSSEETITPGWISPRSFVMQRLAGMI